MFRSLRIDTRLQNFVSFCKASAPKRKFSLPGRLYSVHSNHGTPRSAYIHLPFCKKRCYYCDFPIQAVGLDPGRAPVQLKMEGYVEALCQEIACTEAGDRASLQTVFFGGGTPSLVPPKLVESILKTLDCKFGDPAKDFEKSFARSIQSDAEISMEADPGTFDRQKLVDYASLGVNRFSIGVQAFQEVDTNMQEVLSHCGRSHTMSDVNIAIEDMHALNIKNWSLDLISGLPNVSLDDWMYSLGKAVEAGSTHISIYDLQAMKSTCRHLNEVFNFLKVEESTRFGRQYSPGQFPLPDDDSAAIMYEAASNCLRGAGFEHYEVSSYAKPGFRCRHNRVYWSGKPYFAFGLGAASYVEWKRFSRPKSMTQYKDWVQNLSLRPIKGQLNVAPDPEELLLDKIMLSLRQSDGLDISSISEDFGQQHASKILKAAQPHIQAGLVLQSNNGIRLRDPEGFLLSNTIISDLFAALD